MFYIGAGLAALGVLLPWIDLVIVNISGSSTWAGKIALALLVASALLYWKEKLNLAYGTIIALASTTLSLLTYIIIQIGGFSIDMGFMGSISIFKFIGLGLYLFIIGLGISTFESIRELKSNNQKGLIIGSIIVGIVLAVIAVLIMGDASAMPTDSMSSFF